MKDMITVSTLGQLVRPQNGWMTRKGKTEQIEFELGKFSQIKKVRLA